MMTSDLIQPVLLINGIKDQMIKAFC